MFDAQRFKERLADRGISQGELARQVGVSQQTVSRLASGERYGSKHLHRIARALGTTPAYLSGETDDPYADAPDEPELDTEERRLIDCYRLLDPERRRTLIAVAMGMAGPPPGAVVSTPTQSYGAQPRG